ncbi:MAG: hypothetical protein ACKV2T_09600 [Kofleriaceae bacterium]
MRKLSNLALIGLALSACVTAPSESELSSAAIGPATITTNASTYFFADPITITYAGLNGNASDWIAIAPSGSSLSTVTRWTSTGGGTSGMVMLEGPSTGGNFVARAFDAGTYTLMGESDPFSVTDPGGVTAVLTLNQAAYAMTDPITVSWTGLPGSVTDWIAIAPQGFPVDDQADWQYTNGGMSGSVTFADGLLPTGFPAGVYVARAYLNDTFTLVGESAPFPIGAAVVTNSNTYTTNSPIGVSWQNLPGNAQDWIALAPSGSTPSTVINWVYTGGATNGSTSFAFGLSTPGNYVARAFLDNSYTMLGESAVFTVTAPAPSTISTDKMMYALGEYISVMWNGLPGNANDWIAIAPAGSPDTTVTRWVYTGGAMTGSFAFEGPLTTGSYVARAFQNDTYVKLGESAAFTVQ